MFSWFVISKVFFFFFSVVMTGLGGGEGKGGGCFTGVVVHGLISYHQRHCFT